MICEGRRTSCELLDTHSSQVAQGLLATTSPEARVGFLDMNSDAFFELLLGASKAGRVMVPLNYRLALPELVAIIGDADIELLFVGHEFAALVAPIRTACPGIQFVMSLDGDGLDDYASWRDRQPALDPEVPVDRSSVVLQVYTSGTASQPKGVLLSNGSLLTGLPMLNNDYPCDPAHDVGLVCMPVYHVSGCLWGLTCLYSGLSIVVLRRVSVLEIFQAIAEYCATITVLVPTVIQLLVVAPERSKFDLSSLRMILYGGAPISPALLNRVLDTFPCDFGQVYGLTETGGAVSYLNPEDHRARSAGRLRSCGRPLRQATLRIVSGDGNEVAPGVLGEIICRSAQNMKGYWRTFTGGCVLDRDGWLHTGDVGCIDDDGYLYIHDRLDDMIVSGGENVYPTNIETTLLAHPAVADAGAVGVPDDHWGARLAAFVALKPDAAVTTGELIDFLRERIASFKVPRSIEFVPGLPRNAAGKLLRRVLRLPPV